MPVPALSLMSTPLIPRKRDAYGIGKRNYCQRQENVVIKSKNHKKEKKILHKMIKRQATLAFDNPIFELCAVQGQS